VEGPYKMKYRLASDTWGQEEINAIHRVIASGRYTMGDEVKKFERQFADFFGSKYAVMTNSGSSANLITIAALALNPKYKNKGNIIVPAVSWSTTYFPVHQWGYKLRFVDVDPDTFNIDPKKVIEAIDEDTAAIFTVNLLGNPAELHELKNICYDKGITLLEDNCESLGASEFNKMCGSVGEMGTFSFFFSHHMQTMEGGMVLTNDDLTYEYLKSLRAHGWIRDMADDSPLYQKSGDPFEDSFKFILPGYCVRPLEMSGAIGQEQLKKWPDMMKARRLNSFTAKVSFDGVSGVRLQKEHEMSSWFGFGLVLQDHLKGRRKEVIKLLTENGVETRPIVAGNFMKNPVIDRLNWDSVGTFEGADDLHENGFFIGNDCLDLSKNINMVADILRNIK
jgi:CDP-4-dehydro-6-deoxyglucose reductase, E1